MNPLHQLYKALSDAGKQDDVNFLSIMINVSHAARQTLDIGKEKYQHDPVILRRIEDIECQWSAAGETFKRTLIETAKAVTAVRNDPTDEKVAAFTGISPENRATATVQFANVSRALHTLLTELEGVSRR